MPHRVVAVVDEGMACQESGWGGDPSPGDRKVMCLQSVGMSPVWRRRALCTALSDFSLGPGHMES